jgi:ABC-2 type transport system ATP-binding protein
MMVGSGQEEIVVRLSGVEQSRAHFHLGPVHLEIPKGYVTAIVGPNGSGKSSMFRLLLDLAKPDNGTVELFGEAVGYGDDVTVKRRIGYLPEEAGTYENGLRASDKAAFVRKWYPDWDVNRYGELLKLFEVDPSLKLGKMSKGMRRKFDLTIALAHNPELLLLDEPSSGLDPLAWRKMIDVLHRYMEHGDRTILMSSHIVEEVKRLADYVVFMVQGRVLGMYEKDELLTSWHTLFLSMKDVDDIDWHAVPGFQRLEQQGGQLLKVVTDRASAAERWCAEAGIDIAGNQPMELDDILEVVVEAEKLRTRQHSKGA